MSAVDENVLGRKCICVVVEKLDESSEVHGSAVIYLVRPQ